MSLKALNDYIEEVKDGHYVIPFFQRQQGVWSKKDLFVEKIFDSLYRGFPLGVMHAVKAQASREDCKVRTILPHNHVDQGKAWLLDGQQRTTALAYLFLTDQNPMPYNQKGSWYLHLSHLASYHRVIHHNELEPNSTVEEVLKRLLKVYKEPPKNKDEIYVPVHKLLSDAENTINFIYQEMEKQGVEEKLEIRQALVEINKTLLPVVQTHTALALPEIVNYFVRINTAGTKMGHIDVLLSRVSSRSFDARTVVAKDCEQWKVDNKDISSKQADMERVFGEIVRASMLEKKFPTTQLAAAQSGKFKFREFEGQWKRYFSSYKKVLDLLHQEVPLMKGVTTHNNTLILLTALELTKENSVKCLFDEHPIAMKRWLRWITVTKSENQARMSAWRRIQQLQDKGDMDPPSYSLTKEQFLRNAVVNEKRTPARQAMLDWMEDQVRTRFGCHKVLWVDLHQLQTYGRKVYKKELSSTDRIVDFIAIPPHMQHRFMSDPSVIKINQMSNLDKLTEEVRAKNLLESYSKYLQLPSPGAIKKSKKAA